MDKDELIKILSEWNYWDKELEKFVERAKYGKKIKDLRKTGEIIALTGVRRSGKSTLLKQEILSLMEEYDKKQILYVNLEEPKFSRYLSTDFLELIFQTYREKINPENKIFLFLDEIQNVPEWEKWVRKLYELKKANIYITGSSSKLLGKELGTVLSGRAIVVNIYPLSFQEFLDFKGIKIKNKEDINKNETIIKNLYDEYSIYGGFPKVVLIKENKKEELLNYFQSILLRDVLSRHNLKNFLKIEQIVSYILSNISKFYSANQIKNTLKISMESVLNYISYLKEAFFIFELHKFSSSIKEQLSSKKKIYCIDPGIYNVAGFKTSDNKGIILENIVFLKLIDKKIYYGYGKNECDFLVKKGNKIVEAIQVCHFLNDKNKKREIDGLFEAMETHNLKTGLILTYNQEHEIIHSNKKIKIIPIWKWLLD